MAVILFQKCQDLLNAWHFLANLAVWQHAIIEQKDYDQDFKNLKNDENIVQLRTCFYFDRAETLERETRNLSKIFAVSLFFAENA